MNWRAGIGLLALFLVGLPSCTTSRITAPERTQDSALVYLADYGVFHTSLIMPEPNDGWLEFAFGEWAWFAEGHKSWYRVFPALLWPTPGALGWRQLERDKSVEQLAEESGAEWLAIPVPRSKVEQLRTGLIRLAGEGGAPLAPGQDGEMWYVRTARNYHLMNTCNDVLIAWLRELGCAVTESPVRIDFTLSST